MEHRVVDVDRDELGGRERVRLPRSNRYRYARARNSRTSGYLGGSLPSLDLGESPT
jgi:hypothetical protein